MTVLKHGNAPGIDTPTNEKSPSPTTATGLFFYTTNDLDFTRTERRSKAIATLKSLFGLRGHEVHDGGNLDFTVVHRDWGQSRYCQDFAALVAFAGKVGVRK